MKALLNGKLDQLPAGNSTRLNVVDPEFTTFASMFGNGLAILASDSDFHDLFLEWFSKCSGQSAKPSQASQGQKQRKRAGDCGEKQAGQGVLGNETDAADKTGAHCPENEQRHRMIGLPLAISSQVRQCGHQQHQGQRGEQW